MSHDSNAKIGEQNFIVGSQEHILRLDISMDQFLVMCILQSRSNLHDIGLNILGQETTAFGYM